MYSWDIGLFYIIEISWTHLHFPYSFPSRGILLGYDNLSDATYYKLNFILWKQSIQWLCTIYIHVSTTTVIISIDSQQSYRVRFFRKVCLPSCVTVYQTDEHTLVNLEFHVVRACFPVWDYELPVPVCLYISRCTYLYKPWVSCRTSPFKGPRWWASSPCPLVRL